MRLEGFHSDGQLICKKFYHEDGAHGIWPEKREASLLAKKAYFFNGINAVCLGAEITSHDNSNVLTVVDSRKTDKEIKIVGGDAVIVDENDRYIKDGSRGLWLDGFGGYYFPENMNVTLSKGGVDKEYLEIVVQHGKDPTNGSYAYAVLLIIAEKELEDFAKEPDFEILANNADVQAVKYAGGKEMYIFWNAGCLGNIEVTAPMAVMTVNGKLYASDPTHKPSKASVKLGEKEYEFDFTNKYGGTLEKDI